MGTKKILTTTFIIASFIANTAFSNTDGAKKEMKSKEKTIVKKVDSTSKSTKSKLKDYIHLQTKEGIPVIELPAFTIEADKKK